MAARKKAELENDLEAANKRIKSLELDLDVRDAAEDSGHLVAFARACNALADFFVLAIDNAQEATTEKPAVVKKVATKPREKRTAKKAEEPKEPKTEVEEASFGQKVTAWADGRANAIPILRKALDEIGAPNTKALQPEQHADFLKRLDALYEEVA